MRARRYHPPEPVLLALLAILGPGVRDVVIREHSRYARLHLGMRATTRPGRILLAGSGAAFAADAELVLHEYFHVLRQWNTGRLGRWGYLWETLRCGYRANRFEREARDFAARERARYLALLAGFSAGSGR